ncbi:hypothetical protein [Amycolatopsis sp. NPDC049868]|uniref:hypothetical protein n=1 Tax=Amycolatopsis sp. NPDC049868 TaxID=3363934 RepID=UPI00379A87E0
MRTIRRTLIASALALPLTIGAAGIASADTYGSTAAGPARTVPGPVRPTPAPTAEATRAW